LSGPYVYSGYLIYEVSLYSSFIDKHLRRYGGFKIRLLTNQPGRIKISSMESESITPSYQLRPATASDATRIRQIITLVHINPTGLDWHRFILAVDQAANVIGCGQVKPHHAGLLELASLAVLPDWRSKGVARAIIEYLMQQHPGRLFLTCRASLEPLYQKFGFQTLEVAEMPAYYRRLSRLANLFNRLLRFPERLLVMRKD
jgi:N-acetylglutamate synthase-like GNAT family acetyltransferase